MDSYQQPSAQVDILSTWEITSPIEVRIERLFLGPFAYFLLPQVTNAGRSPKKERREPLSNDLKQTTYSMTSANSRPSKEKVPISSSTSPALLRCNSNELLGFRVVGHLSTGEREICDPVFSDLGHLGQTNSLLGSLSRSEDNSGTNSNSNTTLSYVVNFSSVLSFPFSVSDLSLFSQLDLSLFCSDLGLCFGHIQLPLFGSNGILRQGRFLLPFSVQLSHEFQTASSRKQLEPLNLVRNNDDTDISGEPDDESSGVGENALHPIDPGLLAVELGGSRRRQIYSKRFRRRKMIASKERDTISIYSVTAGHVLTGGSLAQQDSSESATVAPSFLHSNKATDTAPTEASAVPSLEHPSPPRPKTESGSVSYAAAEIDAESDAVLVGMSLSSWSSDDDDDDSDDDSDEDDLSSSSSSSPVASPCSGSADDLDAIQVSRGGFSLSSGNNKLPAVAATLNKKVDKTNQASLISNGDQAISGASKYVMLRGRHLRGQCRRRQQKNTPAHSSDSRGSSSRTEESSDNEHPTLPHIPPPHHGWVRVRSFRVIRRATLRTLNCYKLLDLLERGALPATSDYRCRERVYDLCERNLFRALECFGFLGISLPTFPTPVLFSLQPHPNSLLLSSVNQSASRLLDPFSRSLDSSSRQDTITDFGKLFFENSLSCAWRDAVLTAAKSVVTHSQKHSHSLLTERTQSQPVNNQSEALQHPVPLSAPSSPPFANDNKKSSLYADTLRVCWDTGPAPHLLDGSSGAERWLIEQQRRLRAGEETRASLRWNRDDQQRHYGGRDDLSALALSDSQLVLSIVSRPATCPLSYHNKKLLWANREFLRSRGVGLVKLSASVHEGKDEFAAILATWPVPNIEGVLALLSPVSVHPGVRKFAVEALRSCSDQHVMRYLPQLVQAVRFDDQGVNSALLQHLIQRATTTPAIASQLYWGLFCERADAESGHIYIRGGEQLGNILSNSSPGSLPQRIWKVLTLQRKLVEKIQFISNKIRQSRDRADRRTLQLRSLLMDTATTTIHDVSGGTAADSSDREGEELNLLDLVDPIPLPIEPQYVLLGFVPEQSSVVRSSQYPLILCCNVLVPPDDITTADGRSYWGETKDKLKAKGFKEMQKKYLYKYGDDLRQDQLVTQFICIINELLRSYGCDYCLTVYRVFSLSRSDGLIEFVDRSDSLSAIRKVYPTIRQYFAAATSSNTPTMSTSLQPSATGGESGAPTPTTSITTSSLPPLEKFIRSCSACSVITFLLGVGDRHLDNLMINEDGRLFHVDFGFILGEDPKPFPPPMKLCGEIIDALGGLGSSQYAEFQRRCCQCYRCLRRHSSLFLDMLLLMANSGIRCLRSDPFGVIARVQEKFQLDSSESQAESYLLDVVNVSANALFPAVIDKFHDWTVYWK